MRSWVRTFMILRLRLSAEVPIEIDRNSTTAQIRKAFRTQSLKHHPDKVSDTTTYAKPCPELSVNREVLQKNSGW